MGPNDRIERPAGIGQPRLASIISKAARRGPPRHTKGRSNEELGDGDRARSKDSMLRSVQARPALTRAGRATESAGRRVLTQAGAAAVPIDAGIGRGRRTIPADEVRSEAKMTP